MSAIVRHWSTMLNGSQVDLTTFKKQADDVFAASRRSRSKNHCPATSAGQHFDHQPPGRKTGQWRMTC